MCFGCLHRWCRYCASNLISVLTPDYHTFEVETIVRKFRSTNTHSLAHNTPNLNFDSSTRRRQESEFHQDNSMSNARARCTIAATNSSQRLLVFQRTTFRNAKKTRLQIKNRKQAESKRERTARATCIFMPNFSPQV